jgi:hypothetical protein
VGKKWQAHWESERKKRKRGGYVPVTSRRRTGRRGVMARRKILYRESGKKIEKEESKRKARGKQIEKDPSRQILSTLELILYELAPILPFSNLRTSWYIGTD